MKKTRFILGVVAAVAMVAMSGCNNFGLSNSEDRAEVNGMDFTLYDMDAVEVYLSADGNIDEVSSFKINGVEQLAEPIIDYSTGWVNNPDDPKVEKVVAKNNGKQAVVTYDIKVSDTASGWTAWNLGIKDVQTKDNNAYAMVVRSVVDWIDPQKEYDTGVAGWQGTDTDGTRATGSVTSSDFAGKNIRLTVTLAKKAITLNVIDLADSSEMVNISFPATAN